MHPESPEILTPDWPAPVSVRAAISTRLGGVSQAPFHHFNIAAHVGDDPKAVRKNRQLLAEHLPLPCEPQWLEQVHGINVVDAQPDGDVRCADGSYSCDAGRICLVQTADCLPVLICNAEGTEVAALHAGWRGLAAGIIGAGVGTDGQILLSYDLLGVFTDFKPKFTKRYTNLTEVAVSGLKDYVREVKEGQFPDDDHSYSAKDEEIEKFASMIEKRKQI